MRERGVDQPLVRAHALDVGGSGDRIDLEHAVEAADVETGDAGRGARAEQVRRRLRQPDRRAGRDRGVRGEQGVDGSVVVARPLTGRRVHVITP